MKVERSYVTQRVPTESEGLHNSIHTLFLRVGRGRIDLGNISKDRQSSASKLNACQGWRQVKTVDGCNSGLELVEGLSSLAAASKGTKEDTKISVYE